MAETALDQEFQDGLVRSRGWDVRFDKGRNWRGKIGFVLIPNEQTIEDDMIRIAPEGVGIYFSRAGEARAVAELEKGAPGAEATTLVTSVKNALHHFEARRIVVGTPYTDELNSNVARNLVDGGFEIAGFQGLGLRYDRDMIRVSPDYLVEFAQAIDRPDADALLLSCGALRSLDVVDEIERKLEKPVVVSNQAMIWECLRLAGVEDRIEGYGRLLREF
jgi:maleate isomerase